MIEAKTDHKDTRKVDYPCLKVSLDSGGIVLFTEPKTGTVVRTGISIHHDIGEHLTDWNENLFIPYDGTVTLKNV